MLTIDTYVLYVEDIQVSQGFYTQVLGCVGREPSHRPVWKLSLQTIQHCYSNRTQI